MSINTLEDRVKLFRDAAAFQKTEKIPNLSLAFTWKVHDSAYPVKDALYDWKVMEKAVREFHERYQFDAYMDLGTRNVLGLTDALGGGTHYFDEASNSIYAVEKACFTAADIDGYLKDPIKASRKCFEQKYPNATAKSLMKAQLEMIKFVMYSAKITKIFNKEYQIPVTNTGQFFIPPYENVMFYTGLRELAIGLRRDGEKYKQLFDYMFWTETYPGMIAALDQDTSKFVQDVNTALIGYCSLSPKQFEQFYWPYLKILLDEVAKRNKTIHIFTEQSMLRFSEFFEDVPKGVLVLHPDQDDIFEVRKRLPNVALAGGMRAQMLSNATPEECVDRAKELIEGLGEGYIFSQDNMMSFPNDCKRENLLAVNEFVNNYRP